LERYIASRTAKINGDSWKKSTKKLERGQKKVHRKGNPRKIRPHEKDIQKLSSKFKKVEF